MLLLHTHIMFFSSSPYNGWHRDAHSLKAWAYEFLPSKVTALRWKTFKEDVLQGKKPWIIDFYAPWCGHCQVFKPEFEQVAEVSFQREKGKHRSARKTDRLVVNKN